MSAEVPDEANPFREAALWYAGRGIRVFPLHSPGAGTPCDCRKDGCSSPAKHPRTMRGLLDGTLDARQIEDWWGMWRRANVGVVTGHASGIVVVDVDPHHGGYDTITELTDRYGPFPPTREVATGGGGSHLYFRAPELPIASGNGVLGRGVDLKAEGGYVVAPPSVHASGRPYVWCEPLDHRIAELPGWVVEARRRTASQPNQKGWIVDALVNLREGNRNETMAKLAGWMRRYGATTGDIVAMLRPHALDCGLDVTELLAIAEHVARYQPEPEAACGRVLSVVVPTL